MCPPMVYMNTRFSTSSVRIIERILLALLKNEWVSIMGT
jgi:hypothetical protein